MPLQWLTDLDTTHAHTLARAGDGSIEHAALASLADLEAFAALSAWLWRIDRVMALFSHHASGLTRAQLDWQPPRWRTTGRLAPVPSELD